MIAASVATALAYALYSRLEPRWLVLGWIGLVPWIAVLDRSRSLGAALAIGWVASMTFTVAVFGWFALAIRTYTGLPLAASIAVLALVAPLVQPQFLTFAATRWWSRGRAGAVTVALLGASVYVGTEWLVPKLFGDTLGHGLYSSLWMRQAADLAGAPGLSVVLVLANAAALEAWRALGGDDPSRRAGAAASLIPRLRRAAAPLACVAMLAITLCAYGAWRVRQLATQASAGVPLTAGIVQANLSHYDRLRAELGTYETVRMIIDTHVAMSDEVRAHAALDLLVWPETVYPTTFGRPKSPDGAAFDREIAEYVDRAGMPLVFGAYDVENGDEFNAAVFLAPRTGARAGAAPEFATYRKAWPFPLTEHVPAWFDGPRVRSWLPWLGTWKPGTGATTVAVTLRDGRTIRVGPLICYDVLDPALALAAARDGAELIITLSNDSWFADGAGPRLHLLGAAFRSIETHRPQLRATNTGVSAVITPTGDIVARAEVGERRSLVASVVPTSRTRTLMVAWGDWLGPVAVGVAMLAIAAVALRSRLTRAGRDA